MYSTCFEPEGSSSGRLFCVQVWYNLFTCQPYKQYCRWKSMLGKCIQIIPYLNRNRLPEDEPSVRST